MHAGSLAVTIDIACKRTSWTLELVEHAAQSFACSRECSCLLAARCGRGSFQVRGRTWAGIVV